MGETVESMYKKLISRIHREVLKPLGFKKENGNFRLYHPDGLCKLIHFQRSAWNDQDQCRFCINIGIYYETGDTVQNLKFKDYDCQIRNRAACVSPKYAKDYWWCVFEGRDMEKLYCEITDLLRGDVIPWLEQARSRDEMIAKYGFHPFRLNF